MTSACASLRVPRASARGEFEITGLNLCCLCEGTLRVDLLSRGVAWSDAGTAASLAQALKFIDTIEFRRSLTIDCPEVIASMNSWVDGIDLKRDTDALDLRLYAGYLCSVPRQTGPSS